MIRNSAPNLRRNCYSGADRVDGWRPADECTSSEKVDASALRSASAEEWLTAGRDYSETHFRWLLG
jgi:hypothetical protein